MCTVVILRRPDTAWPLLLAANRDEVLSRPWRAPGRHWPDRAEVVAGMDELAGGSWLGINDHGVVAAVLNRVGTLGPAEGKRSRGELVLEALDHAAARAAASALCDLNPDAYRPFNMIVADAREAYWLRHAGGLPGFGFRTARGEWREVAAIHLVDPLREAALGHGGASEAIQCHPIPDGLSMITARDLNDADSPRIRDYLPHFERAPVPDPEVDYWSGWAELMAARDSADGDPRSAMAIVTDGDYGTVCSSLVAVSAAGRMVMRFAAGLPGEVPFETVPL
jgi:hypothetical protein